MTWTQFSPLNNYEAKCGASLWTLYLRQRQEDHEFEAGLGYLTSDRQALHAQWDPVYQKGEEKGEKEGKGREGRAKSNVENALPWSLVLLFSWGCDSRRYWCSVCHIKSVLSAWYYILQFLVPSRKRDFLMTESSKLAVVQCPHFE